LYSHKFKKSALRYEVALNIQTGDICNIEGPYPPGIYNDQLIFEDALELALEAGECVETDRGYRGAFSRGTVQCPPYEVPERRGMTATVRNRHETCNKSIRNVTANAQHPWFDASVNRRLLRMLAGGEIIISGIGFLFALHPRNIRPLSTTFLCLHTYRSVMFGFMFINLLKEM